MARPIAVVATSALLVSVLPGPLLPAASAGDGPPTAEEDAPENVDPTRSGTWVGRVEGTEVAVALVTDGKKIWAYACDGASTSAFFRGTLVGNSFLANADNGATISGALLEGDAQGTFTSPDGSIVGAFSAKRPVQGGGLFTSEFDTADGSHVALRWIVADDGTQRGNTETTTGGATVTTPAPPLPVETAREQATVPLEVAGGPAPVEELKPESLGGPVPTSTAPPPPPPPPNPPLQALVVAAKVDPPKAELGTPVRYQLTLTNPNPAELTGAGVGVGFPPALTFQPATERTTCRGKLVAFPPGATRPGEPQLVVSGVALAPGASCTADVGVVASAPVAVDVVTNPPTAQGAPPGGPAKATFVIGSTAVTPTTQPPPTTRPPAAATTTRPPATTTRPPATTTRPPATTTTRPPATTTTTRPATTATTPPTGKPSAPRAVEAVALPIRASDGRSNGRIEVRFQPPANDGGSPVTGFAVHCGTGPQNLGQGAVGSTSPIVVAGLQTDVPFLCSVTADSRNGFGPAGLARPVTITFPRAPSVPRNVQAKALPIRPTDGRSNGRIEVTFDAPANDGGAPVTSFQAHCGTGPDNLGQNASGTGSPLTVEGLQVDVVHECSVTAGNQGGTSPAGVAAPVTITFPGAPSVPRGVQAEPLPIRERDGRSDGRIEVSFQPPANDGGSAVTGFAVHCGTTPDAGQTATGTTSPLVVEGLPVDVDLVCRVTADNQAGGGPPGLSEPVVIRFPGAPSAPRNVTAKPLPIRPGDGRSDGGIEVSFEPPENDGGTRVTGFSTHCGTTPDSGQVASGANSPLTVTGLPVDVELVCSVTADNQAGGSPAAVAEAVTIRFPSAPSAPRNVRAKPLPIRPGDGRTSGRIEVSFEAPENDSGSAITSFSVHCGTGPDNLGQNANGAKSPLTVEGLQVDVEQVCSVTADNQGGSSPAGAADAVTVEFPSAPSAPRNVQAKPTVVTESDGQPGGRIELTFDPPERDGGSPVTSFSAHCGTGPDNLGQGVNGSGSPLLVTGLQLGAEFVCTVTATTQGGTGPSASAPPVTVPPAATEPPPPERTTTPAVAPGAPRNVEARALPLRDREGQTAGRVDVGFEAPENDGGSPIASFTATCILPVGGAEISELVVVGSGSSSPVTVSGLQTDFPYTCSVSATNAAGLEGPAAAAAKPVIVLGRPGPPSDVRAKALPLGTASAQQGSVEVSFTAPDEQGAPPVTQFAVRCRVLQTAPRAGDPPVELFASAFGTTSPVTVTGLVVDFRYECSVAAVNRIGEGQGIAAERVAVAGSLGPARDVGAKPLPLRPGDGAGDGRLEVTFAPADSAAPPATTFAVTCTSPQSNPRFGAPLEATATGSASPVTVPGIEVDRNYTCNVVGINQAGRGGAAFAKPAFVPGKPGRARAITVEALPVQEGDGADDGRIEISFLPPEDNGAPPVTSFSARCTSPITTATGTPTNLVAVAFDATSSPVTVTGLRLDHEYRCTLAAVNQIGEGPETFADTKVTVAGRAESGPTTTTTAPAANTPSEPRNVKAIPLALRPTDVDGDDGRVEVSFDVPEDDGGSPITGYTAECRFSDFAAGPTATDKSSPLTLTGFVIQVPYRCTVTASNAAGAGPAATAEVRVVYPGAPSPPRQVEAKPLPIRPNETQQDGRVEVSFLPSERNDGLEVRNYNATCARASDPEGPVRESASGTASPIPVTGLFTGIDYICSVTANNRVNIDQGGVSAPGVAEKTVRVDFPSAPSPPRQVEATPLPIRPNETRQDGRVEVSFLPPERDGGLQITGFSVTCALRGDPSGLNPSASGTASPIPVTGLFTGAPYVCSVTANNRTRANIDQGGVSLPGVAEKSVIVDFPGAPSPPRQVQAKPLPLRPGDGRSDGRAEVSFLESERDGGLPVSYSAHCESATDPFGEFTLGATASPIVVTGLETDVEYTCSVNANNRTRANIDQGGESGAAFADKPVIIEGPLSLVASAESGTSPVPVTFSLLHPPKSIQNWEIDFGDGTPTVKGRGAFPAALPHTFVNTSDQAVTLNAALRLTPVGGEQTVLTASVAVHPVGTVVTIEGIPTPQTFRRGEDGSVRLRIRNPNGTPIAGPLVLTAPASTQITALNRFFTCIANTCTLAEGLGPFEEAPPLSASLTTPSDAPATLELPFDVRSGTLVAQASVRIPVLGVVASAGPDQVVDAVTPAPDGTLVPTRVLLDGGDSLGLEGENVTFAWRRASGPPVGLDTEADPTGRIASFDAPSVSAETRFEFELTVAEAGNRSTASVDRMTVTVFPRNQVPVLEKINVGGLNGRQRGDGEFIPEGEGQLELRPAASDPDRDSLTTSWRVLTPGVRNDQPNADTFKLQWPVQGVPQVIVEATVSDPRGAVDSATVTIGVQPDPLNLQVEAPARVAAGEQLTARATPSRTQGVQVRWTVGSGSALAGFPKTGRDISLTAPDVDTTQVLTLEVTATETATGATATRQVAFEVQAGPALALSVPPTVSVDPGEAASIEATVDGPGNRTFEWTKTFGPDVDLEGADSRTVTFDAPDQATTIGLRLRVSAGGATSTANTVVTVGDAAAAPASGCGEDSAYQQFVDNAAVVLGGVAVLTGFTVQGANPDCEDAVLDGVDLIAGNGLVVGDDLGGSVDQDGVELTQGTVRLPDAFRLPEIDLNTAPIQIAFDGGGAGGGGPPGVPGPAGGGGDACINWNAAFSSAQFPFVPLPPGFSGAGASVAITCTSASLNAQAAAGGATFAVEGALTTEGGADVTAILTNVPVLGGQASGTGSITVAPGGATTYDLSATVTNPSLPIPGLTLNTATARLTPDGLTIAADGAFGQGSGSLAVSMEGSFTSAGLSLAVEASNQAPWAVGPGLTVDAANLVGTVDIDAAGAAIVDLRLAVGGDWRPVPGLRVAGLSLQVANTAVPPECAIPAGGVWVRAAGQGAIDIPGVAPISLGVDSCLGFPTGGAVPPFSLRSTIGGAPWPIAPGVVIRDVAISVNLVDGALTLQASGGATLLGLDLTARVLFLLPGGGGQPTVVVDAAGDLTGLGVPIPEAHVVFASAAVDDFEVAPGVVLDLPQGITGVGTIDLGQPIADLLNEAFNPPTPILPTVTVSISFGTVIEIKAAISLGGDGATLFMGCPGGGTACDPTAPTTTRLALNSAFIRLVLGGSGGFSIGFGADGTLNLPPAEAGGPASPLDLHVEASIQPPARVGLAMFFEGQWQNAMGLSGLTMSNLGIQGSIDFSTTPVPVVTIGITGQVDRVPDPLAEVLGLTNNGEPLRFTVNVDPLAPILELTLGVDDGGIVMRPLTAVGQADALEVDFASVVIAPLGGTVGPVTYSPGVSIGFGTNILDVPVHVNASVDIAAAHINGTVEIGSLSIGGVTFEDTTILLDITPQRFRQTLCGGVHIGSTTLQGLLHVQAGSGGGGPATCGGVTLDPGGASPGALRARFRLNAASLPIGPVNVQQLTVDAQAELDALSANFNATLNVTAQLNVLANNLNVDGTIKFGQQGVQELHVKAIGNVTVGGVQITGDGTCGFPTTTTTVPGTGRAGGGGRSVAAGGGASGACVQLDHAPGTATPFRFGLKGKLSAAGSTASINGTLDASQANISGTLNVPTLGNLNVSGTLVFGNGAQIANATGTAVNASPGDWRVSGRFGSAKSLAGGVSAKWDFAAGRVSGGLFVRGSASVSIAGANVSLAGTFSSSSSGNLTYSLTGSSSASVQGATVGLGLTGAGNLNLLHDAIRLGVFAFPGLAPIGGRVSDEQFPERMRGRMHFDASYSVEVTLSQSGLDINEANIAAKVVYGERFDRDGNDAFSEEPSGNRNTLVNFNLDASGIDEFFEMAVADAATRTQAATFCFDLFGEEFGDC